MNKHSEPLLQKSNFSPPGMINFSNIFISLPKTFQFVLRSRRERNADFVRFVTILPIFAAKRPDYLIFFYLRPWISTDQSTTYCFQICVKYHIQLFESERQGGRALKRGKLQGKIDH